MNFSKIAAISALSLILSACASTQPTPSVQSKQPVSRQHFAVMSGIPEPYTSMENPLPKGHETRDRGAGIFAKHCATCHGEHGAGDGKAGRELTPSPGNLVWLSDIPEKQWDAYMYWATAEGGAALGTAMPGYKETLSPDEIWAVTAYIQANLPFVSQWGIPE